jgi:CHAT domain-containing protein
VIYLASSDEVARVYVDTRVTPNAFKLNDLIQIIQSITNDIFTSSKTMDSATTTMASTMLSNKQKLQRQNAILRSNQASKKIYKEMVSYTEEKARYTDNLLKVYSFLNIIAVGLLLYIYKAADE